MKKTRRLVICSLLTTFSLALFVVELFIPSFPFCPGAKIGLANIIILFMVSNNSFFRAGDCFLVLISRCLLSALLTGRMVAVVFSLSGGILSLIAMTIVRRILRGHNTICVSISGAVCHNIAQIMVAVGVYGTFSAFYYIPSLFLAGVICGVLTGLCVELINKSGLCKFIFKNNEV